MAHHRADAPSVGFADLHAVLRLAHLAGRDHLHGAGDLLGAFDAGDLGADFLAGSHR